MADNDRQPGLTPEAAREFLLKDWSPTKKEALIRGDAGSLWMHFKMVLSQIGTKRPFGNSPGRKGGTAA